MLISKSQSDEAVLSEIGVRMAHRRLEFQLTQADLAKQAGVSKRTVERIEAGASAQSSSMIRIFRVLDLMQALDSMIPEPGPSPMDLLKLKGKVRQRASSNRSEHQPENDWSWGENE